MFSEARLMFIKSLKEVQEQVVYQNMEQTISEEKVFQITYDMIIHILEILDGYDDREYVLIDQKTGEQLNAGYQLHDLVVDYLRQG